MGLLGLWSAVFCFFSTVLAAFFLFVISVFFLFSWKGAREGGHHIQCSRAASLNENIPTSLNPGGDLSGNMYTSRAQATGLPRGVAV